MELFLSISATNLSVYIFLTIVSASFILMVLFGDNEEKTYQKIIGGLSIFTLSLIANNVLVYLTSLFIGGLIIASEKFLKSLAAILKSDGVNMPKTLQALSEGEFSHASQEEIEQEKHEEIKSSNANDAEQNSSESTTPNQLTRLSMEDIFEVEQKIANILSVRFKECFTPNLKLENRYGKLVVDGVIHYSKDSGTLNLDNVLTLVEIKHINQSSNNFGFEMIARRVLQRIRFLLVNKQVLIIFYSKDLTLETAIEKRDRLISIFTKNDEMNDVVFGFFKIDEELNPEILLLSDLHPSVT